MSCLWLCGCNLVSISFSTPQIFSRYASSLRCLLFFFSVAFVSKPRRSILLDCQRGSDRCVHGPMCSRTQPDVPTYSAPVPADRCAHVLISMCPPTQPDVPTDRCAHILSPMCPSMQPDVPADRCAQVLSQMYPRTECPRFQSHVPTHSAPCAHGPMCPRTQPDVPMDRCGHGLMCPRTQPDVPMD